MPRIVYLDETGDHSLENEDKDFPVFALVMMVCDQEAYKNVLVPMVNRLKFDYFGHECVIIHFPRHPKGARRFWFSNRSG